MEWAGPWAFTGSRGPVTVDCGQHSLPYQLRPYKASGDTLQVLTATMRTVLLLLLAVYLTLSPGKLQTATGQGSERRDEEISKG